MDESVDPQAIVVAAVKRILVPIDRSGYKAHFIHTAKEKVMTKLFIIIMDYNL
jgi:hypothetical protein